MKTKHLHPWSVSPQEALLIQRNLKKRLSCVPARGPIRRVGAGDVAYSKQDERLFGAMVILSFPEQGLLDQAWEVGKVDFPYIPGLLSFREAPILLEVAKKIEKAPDVWMFGGHGIAHPQGLGLAAHMGLLLDCPSLGCAKERLVGTHGEVGLQKGDFQLLTIEGKPVGAAVRTRQGVKPIYVSAGFRMDLERAIDLVLQTSTHFRLPEPLRQAHLLSNRVRHQIHLHHPSLL